MQSASSDPEISIGIVNWNTKEYLLGCLESLRRNPGRKRYETIVADNGSVDGSAQAVRERFPDVRVVENGQNLGYAAANNRIFTLSGGKKFLLLNPDTLVSGTTFDAMADFLDAHEDAAAVCPGFLNSDGTFQRLYRRFPGMMLLVSRLYFFSFLVPRALKERLFAAYEYRLPDDTFDMTRTVEQGGTSCMMVRAELFKGKALFDERFPLFFNDVDLARRIEGMGKKIYVLPGATITHFLGKGRSIVKIEEDKEFLVSWLRYIKKYATAAGYLWAKGLVVADLCALTVINGVQALAGKKTPEELRRAVRFRLDIMADKSIMENAHSHA